MVLGLADAVRLSSWVTAQGRSAADESEDAGKNDGGLHVDGGCLIDWFGWEEEMGNGNGDRKEIVPEAERGLNF